jgi:hypothetical protein
MKVPAGAIGSDRQRSGATGVGQQTGNTGREGLGTVEKPLVVEIPAGAGADLIQSDPVRAGLIQSGPLQAVPVDADKKADETRLQPDANMPSGMANVQLLRDGTFVVRAKWYHYASTENVSGHSRGSINGTIVH